MCQCFAERLPGWISCSYTSTEKTRTSGVSFEQRTRTLPSRVVSQTVSAGLTTFLRCSTPGVQIRPHSSRGPSSSSRSTGPLRPCWISPKYIHVDFAFSTTALAVSSPSLKCRRSELGPPERLQPVLLRAHPAQEHAPFLCHRPAPFLDSSPRLAQMSYH